MTEDLKKAIETLEKWEAAYYNGSPVVSDATYDIERDRIIALLRDMDPSNPYLAKVGNKEIDGIWPKFTHTEIMGSLFKINSEEELGKWSKNKGNNYFVTEKIDGWTLAAYYSDGKLTNLVTRGDGIVGDDVSANSRFFRNIKQSLSIKFTGILRGEAFIHLDIFERYFAPLYFKNPRNAAGKIRDREGDDLKEHITVKWFDLISQDSSCHAKTWSEKFNFLKQFNLDVVTHYDNLTPDQVYKIYEEYCKNKRDKLNYWIDGLVIRINDIDKHDALGITDSRPKGSVAFKFPNNGVKTTLHDVIFNRGKSGRMTPVALIHPVEIDGTTVSKASLHGQDWIAELDLQIGDEVEVAKAGDIIPQIIRVISHTKNSHSIKFPTTCPDCKQPLQKNGAYLECTNNTCHGELVGSIGKWVEKTGIKGIGEAMVIAIADRIEDVAGLYSGGENLFIHAANDSEKIGRKVFKEVEKTRTLPLEIFLSALHIDTLGDTNSQRLAKHFKTLDRILAASEEEIKQIDGIDANANKIGEGLQQKKKLISKLRDLIEIEGIAEGTLTNMNFCITGTLSKGRNEVEAWIKQHGGSVQGNVSKTTTYLITDDPNGASGKNQKANQYGTKKITETQLYALAGSSKPERLPIKKFVDSSLFEFSREEAGWIEVEKSQNNSWTIVKTNFAEPTKLCFASWDKTFINLDQISESRSRHLKNNKVEIKRNKITANSYDEVKDAVSKIIFDQLE